MIRCASEEYFWICRCGATHPCIHTHRERERDAVVSQPAAGSSRAAEAKQQRSVRALAASRTTRAQHADRCCTACSPRSSTTPAALHSPCNTEPSEQQNPKAFPRPCSDRWPQGERHGSKGPRAPQGDPPAASPCGAAAPTPTYPRSSLPARFSAFLAAAVSSMTPAHAERYKQRCTGLSVWSVTACLV